MVSNAYQLKSSALRRSAALAVLIAPSHVAITLKSSALRRSAALYDRPAAYRVVSKLKSSALRRSAALIPATHDAPPLLLLKSSALRRSAALELPASHEPREGAVEILSAATQRCTQSHGVFLHGGYAC